MINKKNISRIVISCIILLFVLAGIMQYNAMNSQLEKKSILIEMVLKDDSSDNIISTKTTDKNVELYFDITVMSDISCEAQISLLHNFEPVAFKLNDNKYSNRFKLNIIKSDESLISQNNRLTIRNLDIRINEFCILISLDNTIFTKRFQIINESLDSNSYENKYLDIIKGPVIKHKTEYTIYNLKQNGDVIYLSDIINNNEIQLSVNLNNILENFDLQRTDNEDIIYAIVPILNDGETFGSPLFLKTMESNFAVNIPVEVVSNFDSIRYLIFPYAGSFNVNFLGSYKAFLWSDPIKTQKIRKESLK